MKKLKGGGKLTKVIEASFIAFIAITALGIYDFIIPLFTENFAEGRIKSTNNVIN